MFVAGAALQWLRDGLGLLEHAAESEALARAVPSTEGVYFVPALTGLGSPHWAPDARGLVCGITRGTRREHLVRAALESIAFQLLDVIDAMPERPASLRLDGGAAGNAFLVQLVADVLQLPVEVAAERETTALGAAALAGVAVGRWSETELAAFSRSPMRCEPQRAAAEMEPLVAAGTTPCGGRCSGRDGSVTVPGTVPGTGGHGSSPSSPAGTTPYRAGVTVP